jgi:serine/threonine protein kinase
VLELRLASRSTLSRPLCPTVCHQHLDPIAPLLASAPVAEFSLGSTIVGTYGYMAPEQFTGQASPASDLYSLGATLLYLVSGQPPGAFPQQRMRIAYR